MRGVFNAAWLALALLEGWLAHQHTLLHSSVPRHCKQTSSPLVLLKVNHIALLRCLDHVMLSYKCFFSILQKACRQPDLCAL